MPLPAGTIAGMKACKRSGFAKVCGVWLIRIGADQVLPLSVDWLKAMLLIGTLFEHLLFDTLHSCQAR